MSIVAGAVPTAIALLCFLSLYRAIIGPNTEDRLIAANVMTTKAILVMVVWASFTRSFEFYDIALVSVLLSFVGTVAILKGLQKGDLA